MIGIFRNRRNAYLSSSKSYLEMVTKARSPAMLGTAAEGLKASLGKYEGRDGSNGTRTRTDEICWAERICSIVQIIVRKARNGNCVARPSRGNGPRIAFS
jgi:hypothetical protein